MGEYKVGHRCTVEGKVNIQYETAKILVYIMEKAPNDEQLNKCLTKQKPRI